MSRPRFGLAFLIGLVLGVQQAASAQVQQHDWKIDPNSPVDGNGLTWATAMHTLAGALQTAHDNGVEELDTILVADGVYLPDLQTPLPGSDPNWHEYTFLLSGNLKLVGGFRGYNTEQLNENDYDPYLFESILSGDLDQNDDPLDPFDATDTLENSNHVVLAISLATDVTLAGFHVESGNATTEHDALVVCSGQTPTVKGGGGMQCIDASPRIRDCVFELNHSGHGGAVRLLCGSSPLIANCTFKQNRADQISDAGGAAGSGGGLYMWGECNPTIANCDFRDNYAYHIGGGCAMQDTCAPTIVNCIFYNNDCTQYGGGMRAGSDCSPNIVNCTFFQNTADVDGGGLSANRDGPPGGSVNVIACIFWANDAPSGTQVHAFDANDPAAIYIERCDIQDLTSGGAVGIPSSGSGIGFGPGNFDEDPQFVSTTYPAGSVDDRFRTTDDGLRLRYDSPCLNNGSEALLPDDTADVDGNINNDGDPISLDATLAPRQVNTGSCVDIGAYENQDESCVADLGGGTGGAPDGVVDSADMAILLGRWGAAGGLADITSMNSDTCGDSLVNSYDLSVLLGAWGSCPSQMMQQNQAGAESVGAGAPTPAEVAASMGYESVDELVAWLTTLDEEAMIGWLTLVFGGS